MNTNVVLGLDSPSTLFEEDPIEVAKRGNEITEVEIWGCSGDDTTYERQEELMFEMDHDKPEGGRDLKYREKESQRLRLWTASSPMAPIIVFVHGGSWRSGTYLDSVGSTKVHHLTSKGYAFASVNYSLIPSVTVEDQVQEVADAIAYLAKNASTLGFDGKRIILMGHSSGAHVVTLLGTDTLYLERAGVDIHDIRAVIALDGSHYNAPAEFMDSPGPVAGNLIEGLGTDLERLEWMSPTHHAAAPNAGAFLFLHVHRAGDIRQAIELAVVLKAVGTDATLRVFEGQGFEGHIQLLLRLGHPDYPATSIMDKWLDDHVPVHEN